MKMAVKSAKPQRTSKMAVLQYSAEAVTER